MENPFSGFGFNRAFFLTFLAILLCLLLVFFLAIMGPVYEEELSEEEQRRRKMSNSTRIGIDQVLIGSAYTFLSSVELAIYLPCLRVFRTDPELRHHSCFQLMFQLGLTDLGNIAGQALCGILTLSGYSIPYWLNKVLGAGMAAVWFSYISFLHIIAANRFVEICCKPGAKYKFFDEKMTMVNTFWITAAWLHGLGWFALLLMPQCTFMYFDSIYTWYYDYTREWFEFVTNLNWVLDTVLLKGSILWYIAIVIGMRYMASDLGLTTAAQASMRAKERRILAQAAWIGLYTFVWAQYWNIAPWLTAKGFQYAFALGNLFWVTNSGVNPVIYLTLNKTVSKKVKKMVGCGQNEVAPVIQVPAQATPPNPVVEINE